MNCVRCGRPITSLEDTVDDGSGIMVRMHRGCASGVSVENVGAQEDIATMKHLNPDFQAPKATGLFTGGQQPLLRIKGAIGYDRGKPIYESDLIEKADEPAYSPDQCVLCHRPISGADVVRSGAHVAHQECVRVLLAFVNEPDRPAPVRPSIPAVKAELTEVEERLGRRDALFLVRTLANMVRGSEA